jgi:hypothetical protein
MEFTDADLENIKAAFVSGASKVRIGDREIDYRPQKDLLAAIQFITAQLAGETSTSDNPSMIQATFSKGER